MIVSNQIHEVKHFLFGKNFADGLKITVGIVFPSLLFTWLGHLEIGIILSLGALYVSIPDHPGPVEHKRNGMLSTNFFIFFTALITGLLNQHAWLLALEIPLLCFVFALFSIYGARASAVGTAALLAMITSIDPDRISINSVLYAFLILGGGVWYMLLSLSVSTIRPYRQAQQILGECIIEVAVFMRVKAGFYDDKSSIAENYQKLVAQQVVVSTHQENVREIIYRTREKVKETMKSGRLLIMIFVNIVDLFEHAMSIHHDYAVIRKRYAQYQVLPDFRDLILKVAKELDDLGYALINNEKPRPLVGFERELKNINQKLEVLKAQGESVIVLKKILINIRNITQHLGDIYNFFNAEHLTFLPKTRQADLNKFISHQRFDRKILKNNLSLNSITFRHSIRLATACLLGYFISLYFSLGQQSFWVLLSILVILKPGYGLTKQRNYDRVLGTIAGGLIGALIILWVQDETVKLILIIIFMVLAFSFHRVRYIVSVFFLTPLLLILYSFLDQTNNLDLTKERILFTIIGAAIALASSYFILPNWESFQIKKYLSAMLKANLNYLCLISARLNHKTYSTTSFKLARKEVYVQTGNLGAAFQRMLNEPKKKQKSPSYTNELVVLNHVLSSYLATLSSNVELNHTEKTINKEHLKLIRQSKAFLEAAISNIDQKQFNSAFDLKVIQKEASKESSDTIFIGQQLQLIKKVTVDIEKLSRNF